MNEELFQENSRIKLENSNLKLEISTLKDLAERYRLLLVTMSREKFGRKSEKIKEQNPNQMSMFDFLDENDQAIFNEAEVLNSLEESEKKEIEVKSYRRKQSKKIPLSELPVDEVRIFDLPEDEKICSEHGVPLKKVGEDSVFKIEHIPASKKIIKEVTFIYGPCNDFCGQEERSKESTDILPRTAATPSLLSNMLISKYENALPFYRIEKIWSRYDIEITRATMARWTIEVSLKLSGIMNLMNEDQLSQGYFQCDETPVNVLKLDGKRFESKSYIWTRYSPVVPIVIYEFHPTRSGEVPKKFLEDFTGYMQVDAYAGYNVVTQFKNVIRLVCWAHARKYFFKSYKDEKSKLAFEALKIIKKLFKVEEKAALNKLDYEQRKSLRNIESRPILDELKEWLDKYQSLVRPTSYLGIAIEYTLKRWDLLNVFLLDGRLELSTNFVENKIRPFAVGRKNWLFFDTDKGADAGCIFYSLIETAKANKKDPQKYLEFLFTELPKAKTLEDLEKLLPYDRTLLISQISQNKQS